jgi:hypothetical protein
VSAIDPALNDVIEQLAQRKADALNTLELLRAQRDRVEAEQAFLENPQVVREYLEFFLGAIAEVVAEIERIGGELRERVRRSHVDVLRQIASNCRVEQRRCLAFRDKCINRPLSHEKMRPLLNDISVTTRDQLTAFFDLGNAASRLELAVSTSEPPPDPRLTLNRRALFTRFFKLPKDE